MERWYAVQVRTGREEAVLQLSKKMIDGSVLKECFIPYYERMKRYQGEWHKEQYILFPGYIFLVTEQVDELFWELKKVPGLTKILGDGMEFVPIKEEERVILQKIGGSSHLAEMSKGYIVGDTVIVISGPMKEIKGKIKFINRHKRFAVIEIEMFGRKTEVRLGLEIVTKFLADTKISEDIHGKDVI